MKFNTSAGSEPKLEAGEYDALLMAIVSLDLQPGNPNSQWPSGQRPSNKLKLIYEIPEQKNEDGSTVMQAMNVSASLHERSTLAKHAKCLLRKEIKGEELGKAIQSGDLLGKPIVLTIAHWENDKGYKNIKIAEVNPLHAKIPLPKATRDSFIFDPMEGDLKVWEELTYYTKKQVMESLNASEFSKEMHASWAKAEEDKALKDGDKAAAKAVVSEGDDDLGAIQ